MAERSQNRPRLIARAAPILWIGVIFGFSLAADPASGVEPWFARLASPLIHVAEYMLLAVLLYALGRHWKSVRIIVFGLVVALLDEYLIQAMTSQRISDVLDIVADLAGLSFGIFLAPHVRRMYPLLEWGAAGAAALTMLRLWLNA